MLYMPPSGSTTPDASYVGANVPNGTDGSRVPKSAIEAPQRELVAIIKAAAANGLDNPSATDLTQILKAVRSGLLSRYAATGTPDAIAIAPAVPFLALVEGMRFRVKIPGAAGASNATTTPAFQVSQLGAVTIVKKGNVAPARGDLVVGAVVTLEINAAGNAQIDGAVASDASTGSGSGSGSGAATIRAAVVAFESAGTFNWVATSTAADIVYVGGGGSGGSANVLPGGAPGGGGAVRFARFTSLVIGQSYTFTVGVGGVAIAANTVQSGANGGASSGLGVSAGGGGGGGAGSGSGTAATGGAGGTGSGGDRGFSGTSGQAAANSGSAGQTSYPRAGEAPGFGGGGTSNGADGSGNPYPGLDGTAPGAGGGPGYTNCRSGKGHDGAIYIFPA